MAAKRRPAVTDLAWQCWEVGDQPLADRLLASALDRPADDAERLQVTLAGLEYLCQTYQYAKADQVLQALLAHPPFARNATLWRFGALVASQRELPARQRAYLERMVDLEFRQLPDVMDLNAVRNDLGLLLAHYHQMARAMLTMEMEPPRDFYAKVVRVADQWRSLDPDDPGPCQAAAWILQALGEHDLAWEYFTTLLSRQPNAAQSWWSLAFGLREAGALDLADRAFAAVFEVEPANPLTLWYRAANLQEMGQTEAARRLLRQIAEGSWLPAWEWMRTLAREHLEGR